MRSERQCQAVMRNKELGPLPVPCAVPNLTSHSSFLAAHLLACGWPGPAHVAPRVLACRRRCP